MRIRYFQPASSARGLPLKPTSSAEAAVVASTSSHATAEVARERHREQDGPEGEEQDEVDARPPLGATASRRSVAEVRGRDEHARERRRAP